MKKLLVALVALTCVFMFSLDNASAKQPKPKKKFSPVARLSHSGDIQGTIQCDVASGSDSEALIYLESESFVGESFVVKTPILFQEGDTSDDSDDRRVGAFRFYNVPMGQHKLVIEVQDPATHDVVATEKVDVVVTPKAITVVDPDPIPVSCPQ